MGTGTSYYDSEGRATFLFGDVPIYAVKKATFRDKLGTLHTLLKMIYNSVTYDFTKTALGGAVIFDNNYTNWTFIAPDNRLNFNGFWSMNLGEALQNMRSSIVENPVPAWDQFAAWVYEYGYYVKDIVSNTVAYIRPVSGTYTKINAPNFSTMAGPTFVDLLDVLIKACAPANNKAASLYKTADNRVSVIISLDNSSGDELINMTFTFRE